MSARVDHAPRPAPACRGIEDLEVPFGKDRVQVDFAAKFCRRCPVRRACLELAMTAERERPSARFGVFGGLIPVQRRVLDILGGPVTCRCGVKFYAARTNQLLCSRCTAHRRAAEARRRAAQTARLDAAGLRQHGSRAGYRQHQRRSEEPCEPCRAANSAYYVAARGAREAAA